MMLKSKTVAPRACNRRLLVVFRLLEKKWPSGRFSSIGGFSQKATFGIVEIMVISALVLTMRMSRDNGV
jgi:hypothetical protein